MTGLYCSRLPTAARAAPTAAQVRSLDAMHLEKLVALTWLVFNMLVSHWPLLVLYAWPCAPVAWPVARRPDCVFLLFAPKRAQ